LPPPEYPPPEELWLTGADECWLPPLPELLCAGELVDRLPLYPDPAICPDSLPVTDPPLEPAPLDVLGA